MSEIYRQQVRVEISDEEKRELKSAAALAGIPQEKYIGWVLRTHLAAIGRPVEGSVKA